MTSRNNQQGFTIIEIVIVTFLFAILLMGMLGIFDWHQKVFLLEQAEVRATGSVRTAFNEMTRYIAQGNQILASRTISGQTYNTGASALVLEIPSLNSSGNVIATSFDHVIYYASGTELHQIIEPGTGSVRPAGNRQLSSSLQSLSFTYNNADPTQASSVVVDITAQAQARGTSVVTAHAVDTIFLRNR